MLEVTIVNEKAWQEIYVSHKDNNEAIYSNNCCRNDEAYKLKKAFEEVYRLGKEDEHEKLSIGGYLR